VGRADPRPPAGRRIALRLLAIALALTAPGTAPAASPAVFDPVLSDPQAIAVAGRSRGARRPARLGTRYVRYRGRSRRQTLAYRTRQWDRHASACGEPGVRRWPLVVGLLDVNARAAKPIRVARSSQSRGKRSSTGLRAWINDTYGTCVANEKSACT
jgi:hypothetical protein